MKLRLLGPLVLASVAACHVVLLGDLDVGWDIDGSTSPTLCTTYNIDHWHVLADGPDRVSTDVPCSAAWSTGTVLYSIEEGYYDVTVEAVEQGTGTVLAAVVETNVRVISGDPPAMPTIHFTASDFSAGGDKLNVYWNINGTVDGKAKGVSWDTCDEVGATSAEVEVDGQPSTHDCHAGGNMSAALTGFTGAPQVRIRLLDSANSPLTTWSPLATADGVSGASDTWEYVAEFYWDSFTTLKDTMRGDFDFDVSYEGKDCSQTSPNVAHQVVLLKLDGSAVNPSPDVCGPDSVCTPADGASFAGCYGPGEKQTIADQLWREYKLKVSGALPDTASYEVCWEQEFDIVIGAKTNPTAELDVTRISSAGACAP